MEMRATPKPENKRSSFYASARIRLVLAVTITFAFPIQPLFGLHASSKLETASVQAPETLSRDRSSSAAEEELQTGIALTRQGAFAKAISHLVFAQGKVREEYAASLNLALCYVGTSQFNDAIPILIDLRKTERATAESENLLAQAYIGNGQLQNAFEAFQNSAAKAPNNEKLYIFVVDACMEHQNYEFGLRATDLALKHLPDSPGLHYERAMFLWLLNEVDDADLDFRAASRLAPGSAIAYLAMAQKGLMEGDIPAAVRAAREGAKQYRRNYVLLSILGDALIRSGISAGQPEALEAQTALEKSVTLRPDYAASQIALGRLYLIQGRPNDAIIHLLVGKKLAPNDTSVYSNLAIAYQRLGDRQQARSMLTILARMNQEQADSIRSSADDNKTGYSVTSRGTSRANSPQ